MKFSRFYAIVDALSSHHPLMTDKPTYILQSVLSDTAFTLRVHNVKLTQLSHAQDLPRMFLAHYDSLDDEIRAHTPLSADLLKHINEMMHADDACRLLGLPAGTITPAHHIKLRGTTVIVCDALPLALHLQFTNTAKSSQALHGSDVSELIHNESKRWTLTGVVNVLHKTDNHALISHDMHGDELIISPNDGFITLPNQHSLTTTHTLNTLKDTDAERLALLDTAITEAVMHRVMHGLLDGF